MDTVATDIDDVALLGDLWQDREGLHQRDTIIGILSFRNYLLEFLFRLSQWDDVYVHPKFCRVQQGMVPAAADPDKCAAGAKRADAGAASAFLFAIWVFLCAGRGCGAVCGLAFAAGDRVVDRVVWNGSRPFVECIDGEIPGSGL